MKKTPFIVLLILLLAQATSFVSAKEYLPLKQKTEYYIPSVSDFTMLDLDQDGTNEFYAYIYGSTSYVNVYNETGSLVWNTYLKGMSAIACTGGVSERVNIVHVDDLNANKDLDILSSTKVRASKVTLDPFTLIERELDWVFLQHKLKERWEIRSFDGIATKILTEDINGDGLKEVIASTTNGHVYVFSIGGETINDNSLEGTVYSISTGDLEGDGRMEIAAGTYKSANLISKGQIRWTYEIKNGSKKIHIANIETKEGTKSSVIASNGEEIYSISSDGKYEWAVKASSEVKDITSGDLDNDSATEIIVAAGTGLDAYYPNGSYKWRYELGEEVNSMKKLGENTLGVGVKNRVYLLETDNNYKKNKTAYALLAQAKEYYLGGNCDIALTPAKQALAIFREINNPHGGIECDVIVAQCERDEATKGLADEYYSMAEKYFKEKDYESAKAYAEKAMEIYKSIGYAYGVTFLCDVLISNIEKEVLQSKIAEGDNYYSEAYWAYTNEDIFNATEYLSKAKNIYKEVDYSEGLRKAEELSDLLDKKEKKKAADELFNNAKTLYEAGNYSDALPLEEQANQIYEELNLSEENNAVCSLKNSTEKHIKADDFFSAAKKEYDEGRYENALTQANESRNIYLELEDYANAAKAEDFVSETQRRIDERWMTDLLPIAGGIAGLLIVSAIVLSILKKRKKQYV